MGLRRSENSHALEITLTGSNNRTLRGHLNLTAIGGGAGAAPDQGEVYDSHGAATFVVVVILVYGLSIVLMIGSLAKKNMKAKDADTEEKQINRYLNQASDLKDKSAKENYRQLKRNIISIVNKNPDTPTQPRNSPSLAGENGESTTALSDEHNQAGPSRRRLASESDSLDALLEEDEPLLETPGPSHAQPKPLITPDSGLPDTGAPGEGRFKSPKHTIVTAERPGAQVKTTLVPPDKIQRTTFADSHRGAGRVCQTQRVPGDLQGLPKVAAPEHTKQRVTQGDRFLKPLDINRARRFAGRTSGADTENKIIYNVGESSAGKDDSSCKLSMDADGNIWILKSSPTPSRTGVSSSPSVSTPGSLGYESFQGVTPAPTPSPIPIKIPLPARDAYQTRDQKPNSPPPLDSRVHMPHPRHSTPECRRHSLGSRTRSSPVKGHESPTRLPRTPPPPRVRYSSPRLDRAKTSPRAPPRDVRFTPRSFSIGDSDDEELVQITSL